MTIVVCASLAYSLVNFRGALLATLATRHQVIACAPDDDPVVQARLAAMGVEYRRIPMRRASLSPLSDIRTLVAYLRLFRQVRPHIVLAYTQKPIIYAGLATRLLGTVRFFAMVSGLGHAFSERDGKPRRMLRAVVSTLYRAAVKRAEAVFVFNRDDRPEMIAQGIIGPRHKVVQVAGSGIDTTRFGPRPIPKGPPVFLMIARLMRDKGLYEYAAAARIVREQHPAARFQLLGPFDDNPESIRREELEAWQREGVIDYLGATDDVAPYLAQSSVFVLPTCYREGLPRTILEAIATGRPVVATDAPGCREAVVDGTNGYLVRPRDAESLAAALMRFAADPALAQRMGTASRELAVSEFRVEAVNALIMSTMLASDASHVHGPGRDSRGRVINRIAAILGTVLVLPVLVAVSGAIALTMGRPILFRQRRSGLNGRAFDLLKFRTMIEPDREVDRLVSDERRVTGLGRFLRRTRLDELPGLFNVLRGDMNIIGPRPLLPDTIAAMGTAGDRRGWVRPGLTGWAQVNGGPLLDPADKLDLDIWYTEHASVWLDLRILLKTLLVILLGDRPFHGATHAGAGRRSG